MFGRGRRSEYCGMGGLFGNRRIRARVGSKYQYNPGFLDKFDPTVIRGKAIPPGSIVEITKTHFDPCNVFVYVKDEKGNEQSVAKRSLSPLRKR